MSAYSSTPLAKKLGIRPGDRVAFPGSPPEFASLLAPLPDGVILDEGDTAGLNLAVVFSTRGEDLFERFDLMKRRITPAGILWVGWPKKASGVATDLNESVVRAIGLEAGLVDTKVCAIDDTWSGLKFVYRLKDRPKLKRRQA